MYRLVFTGRFSDRPAWEADKPLVFLGRGEKCDLRLVEDGVSDKHAAIEQLEDGYHIRDLNSATGIRVNDNRVAVTRLATNDEVEIGVVRFRFEVLHPPLPQRRSLDLTQVVVGITVFLLLAGQIALLGSIFSTPRSRKMRIDSGNQPRSAAIVPSPSKPNHGSGEGEEETPLPQLPVGTVAVPTVLNRQLRIVRVDRVDGTTNVVLRIQVRGGVGERELNAALAGVSVQFFGNAENNSIVGVETLRLPMPVRWENFGTQKFTAVFNGLPSRCAGYVVKTYYRNQLQDIKAEPPSLDGSTANTR